MMAQTHAKAVQRWNGVGPSLNASHDLLMVQNHPKAKCHDGTGLTHHQILPRIPWWPGAIPKQCYDGTGLAHRQILPMTS